MNKNKSSTFNFQSYKWSIKMLEHDTHPSMDIPDVMIETINCSPEVKYHSKLLHFVWEPAGRRWCQHGVNHPGFVCKSLSEGRRRSEEDCRGGGGHSKASAKTPQSCPQEISVHSLPLQTPDPEKMYGMYMIWRCTNTISRLSAGRGLHRPPILSPACTHTDTQTHFNTHEHIQR